VSAFTEADGIAAFACTTCRDTGHVADGCHPINCMWCCRDCSPEAVTSEPKPGTLEAARKAYQGALKLIPLTLATQYHGERLEIAVVALIAAERADEAKAKNAAIADFEARLKEFQECPNGCCGHCIEVLCGEPFEKGEATNELRAFVQRVAYHFENQPHPLGEAARELMAEWRT
jgi:hypothetical protein